MNEMKKKDFHAVNDGSIILLLPLTDQGRQFIDEYLKAMDDVKRVSCACLANCMLTL